MPQLLQEEEGRPRLPIEVVIDHHHFGVHLPEDDLLLDIDHQHDVLPPGYHQDTGLHLDIGGQGHALLNIDHKIKLIMQRNCRKKKNDNSGRKMETEFLGQRTVIGQDHGKDILEIDTGLGLMIEIGQVNIGHVLENGAGQDPRIDQGLANIDLGQGQKRKGNIKNINTRDDLIAKTDDDCMNLFLNSCNMHINCRVCFSASDKMGNRDN